MTLKQQIFALELRIRKLEKHAHPLVTFHEDENGFLKVARTANQSKCGQS